MLRVIAGIALASTVAWAAQAGELFDAAHKGDIETVSRLLSSGVPVDEPGQNAETPLIAAVLARQDAVVELLLQRGADVMARNRGGFTPLHAAAYSGNASSARLLIDHGADIADHQNVSGSTPLIVAAEENNAEVGKVLIASGADVAVPDRDGSTALTAAWSKGQIEMVRLLKKNGAKCQSVEALGGEDYYRRCAEAGK